MRKCIVIISCIVFIVTVCSPYVTAYGQSSSVFLNQNLLSRSPSHQPVLLSGIKINPQNPFEIDFLINTPEADQSNRQIQEKGLNLVKYFLASLTIPEDELWVNLSPYESERVISDAFSRTEMGRDLLYQDYILKKMTASLMYPEQALGESFWNKIYAQAFERYGTTEIPVDTFNKVWIVPEKAVVYEEEQGAYVVESRLKIMLEQDYVALEHNSFKTVNGDGRQIGAQEISAKAIREMIIPELEKEINQGEHFAPLRQIYHALILATWYKNRLKETIVAQVYADQKKTAGIEMINAQQQLDEIYDQYVDVFKNGVFNYIKDDYDPLMDEIIPRKYFSGGADWAMMSTLVETTADRSMLSRVVRSGRQLVSLGVALMAPVLGLAESNAISDVTLQEKTKINQMVESTEKMTYLQKTFNISSQDLEDYAPEDPVYIAGQFQEVLDRVVYAARIGEHFANEIKNGEIVDAHRMNEIRHEDIDRTNMIAYQVEEVFRYIENKYNITVVQNENQIKYGTQNHPWTRDYYVMMEFEGGNRVEFTDGIFREGGSMVHSKKGVVLVSEKKAPHVSDLRQKLNGIAEVVVVPNGFSVLETPQGDFQVEFGHIDTVVGIMDQLGVVLVDPVYYSMAKDVIDGVADKLGYQVIEVVEQERGAMPANFITWQIDGKDRYFMPGAETLNRLRDVVGAELTNSYVDLLPTIEGFGLDLGAWRCATNMFYMPEPVSLQTFFNTYDEMNVEEKWDIIQHFVVRYGWNSIEVDQILLFTVGEVLNGDTMVFQYVMQSIGSKEYQIAKRLLKGLSESLKNVGSVDLDYDEFFLVQALRRLVQDDPTSIPVVRDFLDQYDKPNKNSSIQRLKESLKDPSVGKSSENNIKSDGAMISQIKSLLLLGLSTMVSPSMLNADMMASEVNEWYQATVEWVTEGDSDDVKLFDQMINFFDTDTFVSVSENKAGAKRIFNAYERANSNGLQDQMFSLKTAVGEENMLTMMRDMFLFDFLSILKDKNLLFDSLIELGADKPYLFDNNINIDTFSDSITALPDIAKLIEQYGLGHKEVVKGMQAYAWSIYHFFTMNFELSSEQMTNLITIILDTDIDKDLIGANSGGKYGEEFINRIFDSSENHEEAVVYLLGVMVHETGHVIGFEQFDGAINEAGAELYHLVFLQELGEEFLEQRLLKHREMIEQQKGFFNGTFYPDHYLGFGSLLVFYDVFKQYGMNLNYADLLNAMKLKLKVQMERGEFPDLLNLGGDIVVSEAQSEGKRFEIILESFNGKMNALMKQVENPQPPGESDNAMSVDSLIDPMRNVSSDTVGGVDLNPANMIMELQNQGATIFNLGNPDYLKQMNIQGFVPQIIRVTPINDVKSFFNVGIK